MTSHLFNLHGAFPFTNFEDAGDVLHHSQPMLLGDEKPFLYIGQALTKQEFAAYVAAYDFGKLPPSYVVFHHSAIPSATWARFPSGAVWDDAETGLSVDAIKAKRLRQLGKIRDYYGKELGWDRGPHLFVDDKWIYVFTPMYDVGIHAAEGNAIYTNGKLEAYGIGLEVIGYYEKTPWPAAVAQNVGFAVATLQRKLKTFELTFKPGPLHKPRGRLGSLCSHRDFNKPSCPGAAITEDFYVQVCRDALARIEAPQAGPFSAHPRLLGAWQLSGGVWLKDRLTPGLPTAAAFIGTDGCLYQRFERTVARLKADGGVDWLLLGEIAALVAPAS